MSELVPISGEIVKAPPGMPVAPSMMLDEHGKAVVVAPPEDDTVARVFIRVEYADGQIREYQAQEPQDFEIREGMTMRPARLGGPGVVLAGSAAFPSLRLSFKAHPHWNLHIRTEATAPEEFEGITYQ